MQSKPLGPWAQGMVTSIPPTEIRTAPGKNGAAGLLDALNVDIDRSGSVSRRSGWALDQAGAAHSLFAHDGATYGVLDGVLYRLHGMLSLGSVSGRLAWTVLNGEPCFVDAEGVHLIRNGAVIAVPTGSANDEEAELMLRPLPGGSAVSYWNGRLLVARGNSLLWSEPVRFGVFNPLANFVTFEERIRWIAPLESGVFVGLRNSVRFLRGGNPAEFVQSRVATAPGSGAVIKTSGLSPELVQGASEVACWLSDRGFALGLPTGQVVFPQADRLKDLPLAAGRLVVSGDRITVLSNQE